MESGNIFNRKTQKAKRQVLRSAMPAPETRLWAKIRKCQLGVKFRRQHGIGSYIADFYCPEFKLVIELDGDSHFQQGQQEYDHKRDAYMQGLGLCVMRFSNEDVMRNLDDVVAAIFLKLQE